MPAANAYIAKLLETEDLVTEKVSIFSDRIEIYGKPRQTGCLISSAPLIAVI